MDLRETVHDGFVVISLVGDVDRLSARVLEESLLAHFAGGTLHVVIDLERCSYIDSAGLSVLMTHLNRMGLGGVLAVAGPNENLQRLFDIVGLTDRPGFAIYPSTQAAAAAVLARS
jgi:anti-sigma B factor antagonist